MEGASPGSESIGKPRRLPNVAKPEPLSGCILCLPMLHGMARKEIELTSARSFLSNPPGNKKMAACRHLLSGLAKTVENCLFATQTRSCSAGNEKWNTINHPTGGFLQGNPLPVHSHIPYRTSEKMDSKPTTSQAQVGE